ncbi:class I SAM-dependent methyltransferase [Thermodesulfobacteriota bacterium]
MLSRLLTPETRTQDQVRAQYEIEKELADKLRQASREERRRLYPEVYDEFFRRVPYQSQMQRKASPELGRRLVAAQMRFLRKFLKPNLLFLELGPGDCVLAFELAGYVKKVYAVEISKEIAADAGAPPNFYLLISNGTSIPVAENSIDVGYSHQLMEHLHPDDASDQLGNLYQALRPGGIYICITPNRLSGPHDISKHFDYEATGLHLKEYTREELRDLFRRVGFSRIRSYVGARGYYLRFPMAVSVKLEKMLTLFPLGLRRWLCHTVPMRLMLRIQMIGVK